MIYRYSILLHTFLISASRLSHVAESSIGSRHSNTDKYIVNDNVIFNGSNVGDSRIINSEPGQSVYVTETGESEALRKAGNSEYKIMKFFTATAAGPGEEIKMKQDAVTNNMYKENILVKPNLKQYTARGSRIKPKHKTAETHLNPIGGKINGLRLNWARRIRISDKKAKKRSDRVTDWRRVSGVNVTKGQVCSYNCQFLSRSDRRNILVERESRGYEKYTTNIIIWSNEAKIARLRGVTKTYELSGEQNEARDLVEVLTQHGFFFHFISNNVLKSTRVKNPFFMQPINCKMIIQISIQDTNKLASMFHNVNINILPDIEKVCVQILKHGSLYSKTYIRQYKNMNKPEIKEPFHLKQVRDETRQFNTLLSLLISEYFTLNSTTRHTMRARDTVKKQIYIQSDKLSDIKVRLTSATPDEYGHENIPGSKLPLTSPVHSVVSAEIKKVTRSKHCPCARSRHNSVSLNQRYDAISGSENSQVLHMDYTPPVLLTEPGVHLENTDTPELPSLSEHLPRSSNLDDTVNSKILNLLRDNIGSENSIVQQIETILLSKSNVGLDAESEGRIRLRRSKERIKARLVVLMPFELDRLFNYQRVFGAVELAIQKVIDDEIVPQVQLIPIFDDSKCSISDAMNVAIEFYAKKSVDVFIGPVCDYAVAPIARQARYWNIPIISPGALAVDFSFLKAFMFPLLTKVGPHMKSFFQPMLYLFNHYKWKKVKLIFMPNDLTEKFDKFCHIAMDSATQILRNSSLQVEHKSYREQLQLLNDLEYEINTEWAGFVKLV